MGQIISDKFFKYWLLVVVTSIYNYSFGQSNQKRWVSVDKKFIFDKVNTSKWENKTWKLSYSLVSDNGDVKVLYDPVNNKYIKLTSSEFLISTDEINYKIYSLGRWQSVLPDYLMDNEGHYLSNTINVRYNKSITIKVSNNNSYLAPSDNWVWYQFIDGKKIVKQRGKIFDVIPSEDCSYILESENDPQLGSYSFKFVVDTRSIPPILKLDNPKNLYCNTESPKLLLENGDLGKNAKWYLLESGKEIDSTFNNYFILQIKEPRTYTYSVCAKINGKIESDLVSITLNSVKPSKFPENIEVSDNAPCLNSILNLKIKDGDQLDNARLRFSINGNPATFQIESENVITTKVEKSKTIITLSMENSCNHLADRSITVYTHNNGELISNNSQIEVTPYDYAVKDDVVLRFALPTYMKNYKYTWIDMKDNKILGTSETLELKKINKETHVRLELVGKCETRNFYFKPNTKWEQDAKDKEKLKAEEKRIKNKNKLAIKENRIRIRQNEQTEKRERKSNYSAQKKDNSVPTFTGDVNLFGINNRSGQIGLGINYNFYRPSVQSFFALGAGVGLGCGVKYYSEISWNSATLGYDRSSSKNRLKYSFSAHVGIAYNSGIKDVRFDSDSVVNLSGPVNEISFDFLPVVSSYAAITVYNKDNVGWFIGYTKRISPNNYRYTSSQPVSSGDKNFMDFLSLFSPGGITIGWTGKF